MSRDTAVLNVPGIDEAMNRVLREEQRAFFFERGQLARIAQE